MPRAKLQNPIVGTMPSDVEAAFYEALCTADIDKLMDCWADEDDVICVHPGGERLIGVGAIRAAFEALFSNGSVRAEPQRLHAVESLVAAVHSVVERIEVLTPQGPQQAFVVATNVYHKTPQGWRMVAHHASPGSLSDLPEAHSVTHVLH